MKTNQVQYLAKVVRPFFYGNESPLISTAGGGLSQRISAGSEVKVVGALPRGMVRVMIAGCDQLLTVPKVLLNNPESWTET